MKSWKRTLIGVGMLISAVGILGGCGEEQKQAAEETPKEITVYMGVVEKQAQVLAEEFEKDTGIKVNFVRMSGGETLSRIRAEKDAPKADVWYGGSADSYIVAANESLLEPYKSPNADIIPAQYKDKDGYWTGVYQGYLGFICDSRFFSENNVPVPKKWEDLLNPALKGQIIVSNPGSASTGYVLVSALTQMWGEDKAMDYFSKLNGQVKQYTKAGSAPARSAALGECAIGITYIHNGIRLMKEGYTNVELAVPEDGTAYELGAVAIIKNAPAKAGAQKFVDWVLTKKAQELGQQNGSFQFLTNPEAKLPEEAVPFKDAKLIDYDFAWSGENRARLLEAWNAAVKQ
ncbi:ABC transporter substrate-binding protein [Selenomonas sp. TAMA-11512]|uniref:ABC transporter substrate-binding protein n=1 Tax=Selenomonas sp. TAMA-11512 TaxID=3095337 RepID=UPI0030914066|nr:ABC transporter substrate-binding protein [Selenomonas sp. TAMA-11512]